MTKRRSMNIFKVALFMLRRGKSTKPSMHADVASKGRWRKLLGVMRPLHLENKNASTSIIAHPIANAASVVPEEEVQQPPPPPPPPPPQAPSPIVVGVRSVSVEEDDKWVPLLCSGTSGNHEVHDNNAALKYPLPQDNTQSSPSCASSSSYEESRYASAMNLRELDVCEEEEDADDDEDCQFDDSAGDSMIDIKAEMFITQFYEQMRLQNSQTTTYQMIRG